MYARLSGTGSYLPGDPVTNDDLVARGIDTNDEWVVTRTGIRSRHLAEPGATSSQLGLIAARRALEMAGVEAGELDLIIVATSTPDFIFPSTACLIQGQLGNRGATAFDVQAVCAGFTYALGVAEKFIRSGSHKKALVIGAEVFSRILDWSDRGTCVLFGDGAGAVVLEGVTGDGTASDRGILATDLNSDGRYRDILYVDGGTSTGTTGHLVMEGKEVFRHAIEKLAETAHHALDKAGLTPDDVDWIVPHQANIRIIEGTAKRMQVPMDRVVVTVQDHGNTSAASIPLALSVGKARGQIKRGDLVVTEAIGGGLAWGSVVLRW